MRLEPRIKVVSFCSKTLTRIRAYRRHAAAAAAAAAEAVRHHHCNSHHDWSACTGLTRWRGCGAGWTGSGRDVPCWTMIVFGSRRCSVGRSGRLCSMLQWPTLSSTFRPAADFADSWVQLPCVWPVYVKSPNERLVLRMSQVKYRSLCLEPTQIVMTTKFFLKIYDALCYWQNVWQLVFTHFFNSVVTCSCFT